MARVARAFGRRDTRPRVRGAELRVDVHLGAAAGADDDGTIVTADSVRPDDVGGAGGLGAVAVGGDEGLAGRRVEGERGVGDAVVDGEDVGGGVGVGGQGAAAVFVGHHPLLVGELDDGGHAGAVGVGRVGDVVDDFLPCEQVGGDLVDELLAVGGVTLVGVEADELVVVGEEERFPDRSFAIVGDRAAALGDVAEEGPGVAVVGGVVELDVGGGEIGGDGGAGE